MLAEGEITASFLKYRRLLGLAALGLISAMAIAFLREWQPAETERSLGATVALLAVLLGLLAMVGASYLWFRGSLRYLVVLSEERSRQAGTDPLTGVLLRGPFLEALRTALRSCGARGVGFLHLDMDNLKGINDTYGHKAGDAALAHLARSVREAVPNATVGRLGGDEFAVLIEGVVSRESLVARGQAILDLLTRPARLPGLSITLSATIGAAFAPEDGDCVETVLANADLALYAGKSEGRRRIVSFEQGMLADERQARFIERELRGAIITQQLSVHYQPIVDIMGQPIGHYEALVRWQHPYLGNIPPGRFIPLAERSPLIDLLGEWVLKQVCKERLTLGATAININVSPVQLRRAGYAERFLDILAASATPPQAIIVEITETVRLEPNAAEMRNLEALIAAGVRIVIDDFGSGATSLNYLKQFRFHAIKVDRSYIAGCEASPVGMALIAAVAGIGRALDISVVAEGVETEDQHRMLQAAGVTHLQGYLFGRPRPLALQETRFPTLKSA